jgi:hypothetical protein
MNFFIFGGEIVNSFFKRSDPTLCSISNSAVGPTTVLVLMRQKGRVTEIKKDSVSDQAHISGYVSTRLFAPLSYQMITLLLQNRTHHLQRKWQILNYLLRMFER